MQAQPLGDDLTNEIENELITAKQDPKERIKLLIERHDWDESEASKIWCFGPNKLGPNILVDKT